MTGVRRWAILVVKLRFTTTILALLLGSLALPGVATAASGDPCTAAAGAALKVTDPAGGGATYATHPLTVTAVGADDDTGVASSSASAPGARRLDDSDIGNAVFLRDSPGPLTITGDVGTTDPSRPADDRSCTARVSTTVQLLPALTPLISLKRPRKGRDGRGALIYEPNPPFTIIVKHRTGSNRTPITVRARLTRRLRLPKKGVKAATEVVAQRAADFVGQEDVGGAGRCRELICGRKTKQGGWLKSPNVFVFPSESEKLFSKGLKVKLESPDGYPPPFRRGRAQRDRKTPFGADIELIQSGRRIARLRIVASCLGGGQSSKCRFRKLSTKP